MICFLLLLATVFGATQIHPSIVQHSAAAAPIARATLFPRVHAGQTFTYFVQYRTKKNVKTESRVVTHTGPQDAETDAQWLLRIDILDVHPQGQRASIHARSQFQSVASAMAQNNTGAVQTSSGSPAQNPEAKSVDFTILPDGRVDAVTGLVDLFPEQRQVWQVWLRQFAIAGVFPRDGVKPGQSWKSSEPEQAPSPIVKLEWEKQATLRPDSILGDGHRHFKKSSNRNMRGSPHQRRLETKVLTKRHHPRRLQTSWPSHHRQRYRQERNHLVHLFAIWAHRPRHRRRPAIHGCAGN